MRQPGGLSGRSWMAAAAADTPLAAAWVALWSAGGRVDPATVRAFAALGEDRAVRVSLLAMSLGDQAGVGLLADEPWYPPSLRFLVWRDWSRDPAMAPRIAAEIAALPPGDPQIATQTGEPASRRRPRRLAGRGRAGRAHARLLRRRLPGGSAVLRRRGLGLARQPGVQDFGSPVETLFSSDSWHASARGRASVLRRALPADGGLREHLLAAGRRARRLLRRGTGRLRRALRPLIATYPSGRHSRRIGRRSLRDASSGIRPRATAQHLQVGTVVAYGALALGFLVGGKAEALGRGAQLQPDGAERLPLVRKSSRT